jgi:protein-tyrosine phosphatase
MQPQAAAVLRERGIEPDSFRATALSPEGLASTDLVLTAEVEHRDLCMRWNPAIADRTFTLREFGAKVARAVETSPQLLREVAPMPLHTRARTLVQRAEQQRRSSWPTPGRRGALDIDDPYLQPIGVFRRTAEAIDAALEPFFMALAYGREADQASP